MNFCLYFPSWLLLGVFPKFLMRKLASFCSWPLLVLFQFLETPNSSSTMLPCSLQPVYSPAIVGNPLSCTFCQQFLHCLWLFLLPHHFMLNQYTTLNCNCYRSGSFNLVGSIVQFFASFLAGCCIQVMSTMLMPAYSKLLFQ